MTVLFSRPPNLTIHHLPPRSHNPRESRHRRPESGRPLQQRRHRRERLLRAGSSPDLCFQCCSRLVPLTGFIFRLLVDNSSGFGIIGPVLLRFLQTQKHPEVTDGKKITPRALSSVQMILLTLAPGPVDSVFWVFFSPLNSRTAEIHR